MSTSRFRETLVLYYYRGWQTGSCLFGAFNNLVGSYFVPRSAEMGRRRFKSTQPIPTEPAQPPLLPRLFLFPLPTPNRLIAPVLSERPAASFPSVTSISTVCASHLCSLSRRRSSYPASVSIPLFSPSLPPPPLQSTITHPPCLLPTPLQIDPPPPPPGRPSPTRSLHLLTHHPPHTPPSPAIRPDPRFFPARLLGCAGWFLWMGKWAAETRSSGAYETVQ